MRKIKIYSVLLLLTLCYVTLWVVAGEQEEAMLLTPDPVNGKAVYALCASCHGEDGMGKADGSFPVIAGQHREVIIKQLADIRAGDRDNPTMFPFSDPATIGGAQAIADVAAYITTLPIAPVTASRSAAGGGLYLEACASCHGEQGQGNASAFIPRLRGQHAAYLLRQLRAIREGQRKNANPVMQQRISQLSDAELAAVAAYAAAL